MSVCSAHTVCVHKIHHTFIMFSMMTPDTLITFTCTRTKTFPHLSTPSVLLRTLTNTHTHTNTICTHIQGIFIDDDEGHAMWHQLTGVTWDTVESYSRHVTQSHTYTPQQQLNLFVYLSLPTNACLLSTSLSPVSPNLFRVVCLQHLSDLLSVCPSATSLVSESACVISISVCLILYCVGSLYFLVSLL